MKNSKTAQVTAGAIGKIAKLSMPGKVTAKTGIGRAIQGWSNNRKLKRGVNKIEKLTTNFNKANQSIAKTIVGGVNSTTASIAAASTASDLSRRNSYQGSLTAWMNNMGNNPNPNSGSEGSDQNGSTTNVGGGWESKI